MYYIGELAFHPGLRSDEPRLYDLALWSAKTEKCGLSPLVCSLVWLVVTSIWPGKWEKKWRSPSSPHFFTVSNFLMAKLLSETLLLIFDMHQFPFFREGRKKFGESEIGKRASPVHEFGSAYLTRKPESSRSDLGNSPRFLCMIWGK